MKRLAPFIVILTFAFAMMACSFGPSITFDNPFSPSTATPEATAVPTVVTAPQTGRP